MDKKSRELLQTWYFWSPVMLDGALLHFGSRTFKALKLKLDVFVSAVQIQ